MFSSLTRFFLICGVGIVRGWLLSSPMLLSAVHIFVSFVSESLFWELSRNGTSSFPVSVSRNCCVAVL